MKKVRPKKNLGQHFLTDLNIARRIADTVDACPDIPVLEIGPGMGVLTQYLVQKSREVKAVEIDDESVAYLNATYPQLRDQILGEDFLRMDLNQVFGGKQFVLTGNYPYDISSQIFFKMLDYKDLIPCCTGMIQRYVEQGTEETGAVNTVAGMILDYRAFDTLGESFVLFTAVCAVTILMNLSPKKRRPLPKEVVNYAADPIVAGVCRGLIPVILLFGVYILLNGHLSPGGGFSGGAVLAAALMIYALVWGDEAASRTFRASILRAVVVCSLGFYCLAKSYSFFTGANHLHSIISPGTPGNILSGGLILPLNVAVGLVVCCTMYSFYMYFRRGEL